MSIKLLVYGLNVIHITKREVFTKNKILLDQIMFDDEYLQLYDAKIQNNALQFLDKLQISAKVQQGGAVPTIFSRILVW